MVNIRLGKEEFDCNALEGTYDCGCGGEEEEGDAGDKKDATADETKGVEVDARAGEAEDTETTTAAEPVEEVVTPAATPT